MIESRYMTYNMYLGNDFFYICGFESTSQNINGETGLYETIFQRLQICIQGQIRTNSKLGNIIFSI